MVNYVRDAPRKRDALAAPAGESIVGAYLTRANTFSEVDTWRVSTDLDALLKMDPRDAIYGSCVQDIESEIWKRHPIDGEECALVTHRGEGSWEIERTPMLVMPDVTSLQRACAQHKRVLVGQEMVHQMGGTESLQRAGFLVEPRRSRSAWLVRFNPRQVVLNHWKGQVVGVRRFLQPELSPDLTERLFDGVKPEHYPHTHPYAGRLSTEDEVIQRYSYHGSGWGRRRRMASAENMPAAPSTILRHVEIARRLGNGANRYPWRMAEGDGWKDLLTEAVEYIHGIERADDEGWRNLAKWLRREARAMKVRIPRKKTIPPKPGFRKPRRRRRPSIPVRGVPIPGSGRSTGVGEKDEAHLVPVGS